MAGPVQSANAVPTDGDAHFSCALTAVLINRVRRVAGEGAVPELLREAGSTRALTYLEDIGNWVSYDEAVALWNAGITVTGDEHFARHIGEDTVKRLAGSSNSAVLRGLGSPEELLRRVPVAAQRFSVAATLEAVAVRPGYAEIRAFANPGFTRHRRHCEWTAGLLTQATLLFGLPPATVDEEACQADGAPTCRYRVTWEPADGHDVDPAEQIAAMRDQLDAMTQRLESVFATAADLIASGDLDETIARIAERAGLQVRAPRHLLAVRPTPGGEVHCHHRGLDDEEARATAQRILAGHDGEHPSHWLKAPVRSHRNHYGWLVAIFQPGAAFFPQERQLLEVYARYAAAALDGATALAEAKARQQEAQRRYEESRTLLDLARRIAYAGSSDLVAQRLADAVPGVVDCDRISVYLWNEERGLMERRAVNATERGGAEDAGLSTVAPGDVDELASLLADPTPEPVFIDLESSPVRHALRDLGAVAAVAVPISTGEHLLGCLVVSVLDRPERLAPSAELQDRLSGVAAHAVTALENGRLIDHVTHQASHDQLTGLANRVGFGERLADAFDGGRTRAASVALFYLDLDAFKPVNDDFGHEVGDELLCAVAARLREVVRSHDTVARLGGDEFAVLVEDVSGDDQLAAVAQRLERAFDEPFDVGERTFAIGASIGRAVWPLDVETPDALLAHADAAMYAVKRGSRHA
jgi:diguanylate cyclase (GGDEF)-like protein